MHTAQPGTEGKYGMGWWIRQESGLSIIAAEGGSPDAYALLELIPAKRIAVVIVANSYSQIVGGLKHQVLSALFPEVKFAERPNGTQTEPPSPASPALVGKWSGEMLTFKGPVKLVLDIAPEGGAQEKMADQPGAAVTNVAFDATSFHGRLPGNGELADSPHPPFMIDLDLELHNDRLIGAATFGPMPGKGGDQLPHFITLAKVPAKR
jgi:hypothetical protein